MPEASKTAGIDVAQPALDIWLSMAPTNVLTPPIHRQDGGHLADALAAAGVERVGVEATGGYERGLAQYLRSRGVTVVLLQPAQVKALGKRHSSAPRPIVSMRR